MAISFSKLRSETHNWKTCT